MKHQRKPFFYVRQSIYLGAAITIGFLGWKHLKTVNELASVRNENSKLLRQSETQPYFLLTKASIKTRVTAYAPHRSSGFAEYFANGMPVHDVVGAAVSPALERSGLSMNSLALVTFTNGNMQVIKVIDRTAQHIGHKTLDIVFKNQRQAKQFGVKVAKVTPLICDDPTSTR